MDYLDPEKENAHKDEQIAKLLADKDKLYLEIVLIAISQAIFELKYPEATEKQEFIMAGIVKLILRMQTISEVEEFCKNYLPSLPFPDIEQLTRIKRLSYDQFLEETSPPTNTIDQK